MSVETTDHLVVEVSDKVATLTLNQPEKLNALSGAMTRAGIEHLKAFAQDPEIGAIVVTGAGRAFCAGGDVSGFGGYSGGDSGTPPSPEERIDGMRAGQELSWLLYTIPKVTIAAVNGHAMGAGLGISMSCDLRLASDKAKFGTAFAKVGFSGDYGTTWQLTQLVGQAKAKELFLLPDIIDAEEAHRIGLVNRVFAHDGFMDEVRSIATRLANGPLVSQRYIKENINLSVDSDFRSILDREALTNVRCSQTEDFVEGFTSFLEKREPQFKGR